jgi:hypothetical protein
MTDPKNANDLFDTLAKILLRCFVLGYFFLLLWFAVYIFAGDVVYAIGGRLFGLAQHELDMINYCGMAVVKVAVVLFFLFPYIAIRLVFRKATDPR